MRTILVIFVLIGIVAFVSANPTGTEAQATPTLNTIDVTSVGPSVIQVLVSLENVTSSTTVYYQYKRTSDTAWTSGGTSSTSNNNTSITISGSFVDGRTYDVEASLASDYSDAVSNIHTHLSTTLLIVDNNDDELWEVSDLTDIAGSDSDVGNFPAGLDGLRSAEEHEGWVWIIDNDTDSLYRSRNPTSVSGNFVDDWTLVCELGPWSGQSRSLLSIEGDLWHVTVNGSTTRVERIVDPTDCSGDATDTDDAFTLAGFSAQGGVYIDGNLYLGTSSTVRRIPDINNPTSNVTNTSLSGHSHLRGMTNFNGRIILSEEDSRGIYEFMDPTGSPSAVLLGNTSNSIRWGGALAAWSNNPAPIVESITASDGSGVTATITVNATRADPDGQPFNLRYRATGDTNWIPTTPTSSTTASATFSLSGLSLNTTYELQASMDDNFPADDTANETLTTTLAAPDAPLNLTLTPTNVSIGVTWDEPPDGGSPIESYDLDYKLDSAADWTETSHSGLSTSFTIGGLTQGETYQVRVAATNGVGTGPYAESSVVVSGVLGAITTVSEEDTWIDTVDISWSEVDDAESYTVQWRLSTGTYNSTNSGTTSDTTFRISGLNGKYQLPF